MPGYLEELRRQVTQSVPGARLYVFGHVADGNLHITVSVGAAHDRAATERSARESPAGTSEGLPGGDETRFTMVERCVYEPLRSLSGSISAEHGIGLERKAYLGISRSAAEIATMRALKTALDPHGILNPGKIFDVQTT
jgi:FAD/FMN-containing dehydrogenase